MSLQESWGLEWPCRLSSGVDGHLNTAAQRQNRNRVSADDEIVPQFRGTTADERFACELLEPDVRLGRNSISCIEDTCRGRSKTRRHIV
jgi:hypothetical protein